MMIRTIMSKTPNIEVTDADRERWRAVDAIVERIIGGCTEEEFSRLRCPVCSAPLSINVNPKLTAFFLRCTASSLHVGKTVETATAHDWWRSKVGGWYEDEE